MTLKYAAAACIAVARILATGTVTSFVVPPVISKCFGLTTSTSPLFASIAPPSSIAERYFQLEEMEDGESSTTEIYLNDNGTVTFFESNGPIAVEKEGDWATSGTDFVMILRRVFEAGHDENHHTEMGKFTFEVERTFQGTITKVGIATAIEGTIHDIDELFGDRKIGYFQMIDTSEDRMKYLGGHSTDSSSVPDSLNVVVEATSNGAATTNNGAVSAPVVNNNGAAAATNGATIGDGAGHTESSDPFAEYNATAPPKTTNDPFGTSIVDIFEEAEIEAKDPFAEYKQAAAEAGVNNNNDPFDSMTTTETKSEPTPEATATIHETTKDSSSRSSAETTTSGDPTLSTTTTPAASTPAPPASIDVSTASPPSTGSVGESTTNAEASPSSTAPAASISTSLGESTSTASFDRPSTPFDSYATQMSSSISDGIPPGTAQQPSDVPIQPSPATTNPDPFASYYENQKRTGSSIDEGSSGLTASRPEQPSVKFIQLDDSSVTPKVNAQQEGTNSFLEPLIAGGHIVNEAKRLEGVDTEELIERAKQVLRVSCGLDDESVLADNFELFTAAKPDQPVSREAFLQTHVSNEVDAAFPDFDNRYYNFHVDPFDSNRVWYNVRPTATHTGDWNGQAATKKRIYVPPQAQSFVFDEKGKVTTMTVGYVKDRRIGNTGGMGGTAGLWNGIQNTLRAEEPTLVLNALNVNDEDKYSQHRIGRALNQFEPRIAGGHVINQAKRLELSTFPMSGTDLLEKAKQVLRVSCGLDDESVLADSFQFYTAGSNKAVSRQDFLQTHTSDQIQKAFPDYDNRYYNFHVDPFELNRVWYHIRPTATHLGDWKMWAKMASGKRVYLPPQAQSMVFDTRGKVTAMTVGYVLDKHIGNTAGCAGTYGLLKGIGGVREKQRT